jgi:uroporphyrinogen-III synthase
MRVLVTRPLPDGERTAAALRAVGHDVLLIPLMQVRPVPAVVAGEWSAVIVTSANALRVLSLAQLKPLLGLPLFAVGQRSAEAARAAGFSEIRASQGDAEDLVRLVAERYAGQSAPHLYLAGEDRAADIAGALAKHSIKVEIVVVYRNMTTGFPPELFAAIEQETIDAVLHFSRRSAENYLAGARAAGLVAQAIAPRQLCLSPQIAEPLVAAAAPRIEIARRPDEVAMLELLQRAA